MIDHVPCFEWPTWKSNLEQTLLQMVYISSLHLKAKKHEKKLDNEKEIVKICRFVYLLCMTYHPIFRRYFIEKSINLQDIISWILMAGPFENFCTF